MRVAQSDYDKSWRCPGWSGSGWTHNKRNWCDGNLPEGVSRWRGGARYYGFGWTLRFQRTNCCNTLVLPYALVWLNWRTWKPTRYGFGLWYWYPGMRWKQNLSSLRWKIVRLFSRH